MAFTPEERAAHEKEQRIQQAKKQVRFAPDDFRQVVSKKQLEEQPPGNLRRRSLSANERRLSNPLAEHTVTLENGETEVQQSEGIDLDELVHVLSGDKWTNFRYLRTPESLMDELTEKIEYLAATGAGEGGASFLFRPMTIEGKKEFPEIDGPFDLGAFLNRLDTDARVEALYLEFKFRNFAMQAQALQINELHAVAKELDHNLNQLATWVLSANGVIDNLQIDVDLWRHRAEGEDNEHDTDNNAPDLLDRLRRRSRVVTRKSPSFWNAFLGLKRT